MLPRQPAAGFSPAAGGGIPPRPSAGSPGSAAPAGWAPPRPAGAAPVPGGDVIPAAAMAKRWPEVLDRLRGADPVVHGYLKGARCASSTDGVVHFETASPFHRQGLETGEMKSSVEGALSAIAGTAVSITVRSPGESAAPVPARPARAAEVETPARSGPAAVQPPARPATPASGPSGGPPPSAAVPAPAAGAPSPDWVDREPMVKAALDVFKGRLLDVKRPPAK